MSPLWEAALESLPKFHAMASLSQDTHFSARTSRHFVMSLSTALLIICLLLWTVGSVRPGIQLCGLTRVPMTLYGNHSGFTLNRCWLKSFIHSFIHLFTHFLINDLLSITWHCSWSWGMQAVGLLLCCPLLQSEYLCPPRFIYTETLTPSVPVLGDRAYREVIKVK